MNLIIDSASASQTAATGHAATPAAVATAVATVDSKFGNYLPLSGGTMTADIVMTGYSAIDFRENSNIWAPDDRVFTIHGGRQWDNCPKISFFGKDQDQLPGHVGIYATDGTNKANYFFLGQAIFPFLTVVPI